MIILDEKPPLDEALLIHYGVKGMKWGVHKAEPSSGTVEKAKSQLSPSRFTPEQKARAKKVAVGVGILMVAAGAAYVAANRGENVKLPVSSIKSAGSKAATAKKLVDKVAEQTDIIHASRGRDKGFHFLEKGGLPDPLSAYDSAFGTESGKSKVFRKLADGRIAATFPDPEGRKDHAGRVIPHEVVVPKIMAAALHTLDDVVDTVWPIIKPGYDAMYQETLKR